jgi:hypothetical protein
VAVDDVLDLQVDACGVGQELIEAESSDLHDLMGAFER